MNYILYRQSILEIKHIFRIMKITIVALFTCIYTLFAVEANSQNAKISILANGLSVQKVISEIEKQTDYLFVYDKNEVNVNRKVYLKFENETVAEVLNKVFEGTGVAYKVVGKNITLAKGIVMAENLVKQQVSKKVTGVIKDQNGEPIIGANVVEKGTTNGIITDLDGKFSLIVSDNAVMQVSYIGYVAQEITVGNRSVWDIVLKEDSQSLDEVVVVGYGTQKKVNLTGSVQALEGDVIKDRPVMNVTQALQGQVSGVNFDMVTDGNGYEPGASLNFSIRGQGNAYVLIDGVEGSLDRLNPNDIESISILKDAAASAIYGARAPYGVVLVTTKSGGREMKPRVNFSANVATSKIHRKPKMLDSYTFARVMNEAGVNGGGLVFTESTIDRIIAYQNDPSLPETVPASTNPSIWASVNESNANHDWYDEYYGSGLRNQENISIQGGGKSTSYFISAGHAYDDGILKFDITDYYRRYNMNSKLDVDLAKWWKFTTNTRLESTTREYANFDNQGSYNLLFHHIARTFPTQALKSPNDVYTVQSKVPWAKDAGTDKKNLITLTQRFATEITPLKGWKINLDYSLRLTAQKFTSENFTAYEDKVDGSMVASGTTIPSYVSKDQKQTLYQTTNMYTSYNFNLNGHDVTLMGGVQYEHEQSEYLAGRKDDLVTSDIPSFSTATGSIQSLTDELAHWSTAGAFFRVNYNYKDRYLVEANGRYDGTSKFAKGNRWGFFPSFSLGWNIAREEFWKKFEDKVSHLKVRASWGQLGNQGTPSNPIDPYQDLALMNISSNLGWIVNGERPVYATAPALINRYLTWETSETFDIGLDISALNNRLNVTGDYYVRTTRDRLGPSRALPIVIGATLPKENNSEMRTNGWEISVNWRDRLSCGVGYSVTAMLSDYQNTITKYNNPTNILTTNYEGQKVGDIWGFVTDGLIQTDEEAQEIMDNKRQAYFHSTWRTGDVKYKDLNGDGVIDKGKNTVDDHGDMKIIGNSTPRYQFGLTLAADYKGFDFSVLFQGVAKRDLWLSGNMFWGFSGAWNQCSLFTDHLDYYRDTEATEYVGLGVNTDSYFPRPYHTNEQNKNYQAQTRYLQNGAYLRLKNMSLGYTLPTSLTKTIALERVRFYVTGENLFTVTGRYPSSLDPETGNIGGRGNGKSYPPLQVFAFGIDLQF